MIRRPQQILSKKNTYSLEINERNMKTGQVTGHSKIARIADTETYALLTYGAKAALKEYLGPRSDNMSSKTSMYKDISLYGYTYQSDMDYDIRSNQTLNTVYTYLIAAGLQNDLLELPEDRQIKVPESEKLKRIKDIRQ